MDSILITFAVVTCARFAVVAYMVRAAWKSGKGVFLFAALLLALLGGYSLKAKPDVCPECGHVLNNSAEMRQVQ